MNTMPVDANFFENGIKKLPFQMKTDTREQAKTIRMAIPCGREFFEKGLK